MLGKLLNKIRKSDFRIRLTLNPPTNEMIIREVPSDLNKIAFTSQLLSQLDKAILRMNFHENTLGIVTFSKSDADNIGNLMVRHNIDFERLDYIPPVNNNAVVVRSSPQFQFTNFNSIVKINQEEMDETRTEFIQQSITIILEQFSQLDIPVDFMIRMRKITDEELSDVRASLDQRFRIFRKDASYTHMTQAEGLMLEHRVSTEVVRFESVGIATLLQNQEEDLMHAREVFAFEIIVFAHEQSLKDVESILQTLPNVLMKREYDIDCKERVEDYITYGMLSDGTYPVASVNILSKYLNFEGGSLVHIKESVVFKIPTKQVFLPDPRKANVLIGRVEKAHHYALLKIANEHCFITGATGSGKTNAAFVIMEQLIRQGIKVLVIEPTKGEWFNLAGLFDLSAHGIFVPSPEIICLGNPETAVGLLFNPFTVPIGVSTDSHIQLIGNAFAVAFGDSLTPPQYSILSTCIYQLYEQYVNPSFTDLIEIIDQYDDPKQQKGMGLKEVKEALVRKMIPFTNGSIGHCFNVQNGITPQELLNNNVVINLAWLKDEKMKSFIVASMLSSCAGYLERNGTSKGEMRHKIVIEEAHRIFPAIHPSKMDSPAGGAVKVISELLKEVRASDVSVDICDQSPGAVYRDAILNTAIKLAFRTADGADKRVLEDSMMLQEEQADIMPSMMPGRCFVHAPNTFPDPFIVQFSRIDEIYKQKLVENGIRNPVPIDPNVRNLAGKTITDQRICDVASNFYRNLGILWKPYTGEEFASKRMQIRREKEIEELIEERNQESMQQPPKTMVQKETITLPAKNLDDILNYLKYTKFCPEISDKKAIILAVMKNHARFSCKSQFYCAENIATSVSNECEMIAPDVIGRFFLKLIDCGVLKHTVSQGHGAVYMIEGFDVSTVGLSPKDVKWYIPENKVDIKTESMEIQPVDVRSLENTEEGDINSIHWISGTNNNQQILYVYVKSVTPQLLSEIYFAACNAEENTPIDTIYVTGKKDVIDTIQNDIPNSMASSKDLDFIKFLTAIKLKVDESTDY